MLDSHFYHLAFKLINDSVLISPMRFSLTSVFRDIMLLNTRFSGRQNGTEMFFETFNGFSFQYKANKNHANNKSLYTRISARAMCSYALDNVIACRILLKIHSFKTQWRKKLKLLIMFHFLWLLKVFVIE